MDLLDLTDVVSLLKQYGPLIVVVAFFMWQGWVRENKMTARINKLEDEQRKVLLPLVAKCSKVIAKNSIIMRRLERVMDERWARHDQE